MRSVMIAGVCVACLTASAFAQVDKPARPTYSTVLLVDAPLISIDGDLSDWQGIRAPAEPVATWQQGQEKCTGPGDLSAQFQACVDAENLYVAVNVADDWVVSGIPELFGKRARNDRVFVYVDGDLAHTLDDISKATGNSYLLYRGYDDNDAEINITLDEKGEGRLQGNVGRIGNVPYLWEAVGVRAAMRTDGDGYAVEMAIPRDVRGLDAFASGPVSASTWR